MNAPTKPQPGPNQLAQRDPLPKPIPTTTGTGSAPASVPTAHSSTTNESQGEQAEVEVLPSANSATDSKGAGEAIGDPTASTADQTSCEHLTQVIGNLAETSIQAAQRSALAAIVCGYMICMLRAMWPGDPAKMYVHLQTKVRVSEKTARRYESLSERVTLKGIVPLALLAEIQREGLTESTQAKLEALVGHLKLSDLYVATGILPDKKGRKAAVKAKGTGPAARAQNWDEEVEVTVAHLAALKEMAKSKDIAIAEVSKAVKELQGL